MFRILIGFGVVLGSLLMAAGVTVSAQDTVKLAGNHPTDIAEASTGHIAPERVLTMAVALKLRNQAELNRLLSEQQDPSSLNYRRWLTPQEFSTRFGPDPSRMKAVKEWLAEQGFEVVSSSLERRSITFKGSAALAERVFETKILTYGDGSSYANETDPSVPARFEGVIGAITGLDNTAHAMPLSTR